jgi:hypothetical protein
MALAAIAPIAAAPLLRLHLGLLLWLRAPAKTAKTARPFCMPLLKLRLLLTLFKLAAVIFHLVPLPLHLVLLLTLLKLAAIIFQLVPLPLHLILLLTLLKLAAVIPSVISTHNPFRLLAFFFKPTHVISLAVPDTPVVGYIVTLAAVEPLHPFRSKVIVIAIHAWPVNRHFIISKLGSAWSCYIPHGYGTYRLAGIPFNFAPAGACHKYIPLPAIIIDDGSMVDEHGIALHPIAIIIYTR